MMLSFVLFADSYRTKKYGRNISVDSLLMSDDSAWYEYEKIIYNGRCEVITIIYLI
jgi:hypothetical protein